MRYTGIQPQYFPRLHYFARILNSDIFVVRDDVQFVRKHSYPGGRIDKSYQVHTPIKQSFGRFLLTVPTKHQGRLPIFQTKVSYGNDWVGNHLKTIQNCYSKAPYFSKVFPEVKKLLSKRFENLSTLNTSTITWGLFRVLGELPLLKGEVGLKQTNSVFQKQQKFQLKNISMASDILSNSQAQKLDANEKIIALCKEVRADEEYCGGTAFEAYIDQEYYKKHGIGLTIQNWTCKKYRQMFNKQSGFIFNLSILDLLMNVSSQKARGILSSSD